MSATKSILKMNTAKAEAQEAMAHVIHAVRYSRPVDAEDLVVIRGSSELFAELAETYISVRTEQ